MVTTWVAMVPINSYLHGSLLDIAKSALSLSYIIFIWKITPIREMEFLMIIESSAMIYAWAAFLERYLHKIVALESQWLSVHEQSIMTYCFFLEIIIIMGGMAHCGFKRLSALRANATTDSPRDNCSLSYG
jgi:hypothetical protein